MWELSSARGPFPGPFYSRMFILPQHGVGPSDGQQVQKGPRPHCRRYSLSVGPRADNRAKGPQVAQGAHRLFPLARPCLCPAASCLSWSCLWVSCWLRLLKQSRA